MQNGLKSLCICLSLWVIGTIFHGSLVAVDENLSAEQLKLRNQRIAQMISALTDERQRVNERAIQGLVNIGRPTIPDLRILAEDESPTLRLRVALVVCQIPGPEAEELLLSLSNDTETAVREVATIGLGRKNSDMVMRRLAVLLNDEEPSVRESAALALGFADDGRGIRLLAHSFVAEQIPVNATPVEDLALRRSRSAQFNALRSLAIRPQHIDAVGRYLVQLDGPALHTLLEVTWEIGDPRLCLPLLEVLKRDVDLESQGYAAKSLSANGDSRCLADLCAIAASDEGPRLEAAKTLAVLTGHQSGPGPGWLIWLRDHQELLTRVQLRDTLIARLHDPAHTVTRDELAVFEPHELQSIISGILGRGAKHWPELALRAINIDDPQRWTSYLLKLHAEEPVEVKRIGILLLLDRLNDPAARATLQERYQIMSDSMRKAHELGAYDKSTNSERPILALFK